MSLLETSAVDDAAIAANGVLGLFLAYNTLQIHTQVQLFGAP
jgi:hypothetical protein